MSVCPYCGSEVEEFDCICGKCGKTIEPQDNNKGTTYNSNSSYNSNSYSGGGNGDYTIYPPYNPANDSSAYPPYNRSAVGSNPTVKSKKNSALVIGIGIALVVLVMAIILRPIIWEYKTKEYRHVVQAYTEASLKGNYTACYNYVYPNAGKIISDLVGETQALSIMNSSGWITKSVRNSLLDSYNLDYNDIKMKIEMKSISNLSGSKKKNV
ncbi:MAG: hypothetical protein K2N34_12045, partial [Lachnospiraceae bacterium]|nr:hypothetical protein [Lachnospiraceae bacterium]